MVAPTTFAWGRVEFESVRGTEWHNYTSRPSPPARWFYLLDRYLHYLNIELDEDSGPCQDNISRIVDCAWNDFEEFSIANNV